MVMDAFQLGNGHNVSLRLIGKHAKDSKMCNIPIAEEVALLIVGDIENLQSGKDIIVEHNSGVLKYINEHYPSYLGLQYPLLFPYGEYGFTKGI